MTNEEYQRALETYAAYRGRDFGPVEATEFRGMFADQSFAVAVRAIRDAAAATSYVTLADVLRARNRHRDEALAKAIRERQAEARGTGPIDSSRPGFPVAPGEPTGSYLVWLTIGAILGQRASVERTAKRFVEAGLVLEEHAERVLAAIDPAAHGVMRAEQAKRAVEEVEFEIGAWARVRAEQYVSNAKSAAGQAA